MGQHLHGDEGLSWVRSRFGTKELVRGVNELCSGLGYYSEKIVDEVICRVSTNPIQKRERRLLII